VVCVCVDEKDRELYRNGLRKLSSFVRN